MDICIVGPGAIGLFLAVEFSQTHNVWLVAKDHQIEDLSDKELSILGARELTSNSIRVIRSSDLHILPEDVSFWLAIKAYDIPTVIEEVKPYITEKTPTVILSNGLNVYLDAAMTLSPRSPLVRVCNSFGVQKPSPMSVALAGDINCTIAAPSHLKKAFDSIYQLLAPIADNIEVEPDVATAEWRKLPTNLVVNTVCTIHDRENGFILEDAEANTLVRKLLEEIKQVALADGFDISEHCSESFFERLKAHASNTNATLADVRAGRKTELDYILGRFLRLARHYEIDVPASFSLYQESSIIRNEVQF